MWQLQGKGEEASQGVDKSVCVPPEILPETREGRQHKRDPQDRPAKTQAWLKEASATSRWNAWKQRLFTSAKAPTEDQWKVIEVIYARCLRMRQEHNTNSQKKSLEEPLRLMIQGLPGAGKSQVIQWVRSFFEDVLGWEHGREFVCVASMNTMAALIGGLTIHSWGEIPVNSEKCLQKAFPPEVLHLLRLVMSFVRILKSFGLGRVRGGKTSGAAHCE